MDFLTDYAIFLAKTVTLVIAILVVLASFAALRSKGRRKSSGQLQVSKLNDFYKGLRERLEQTLLDKDQLKALRKVEAKSDKKQKKKPAETNTDASAQASASSDAKHTEIHEPTADADAAGRNYWLLKAEPETRIEKGKDVKFSIDDLAAMNDPAGWDGGEWDSQEKVS